jgi:hypothetical protein
MTERIETENISSETSEAIGKRVISSRSRSPSVAAVTRPSYPDAPANERVGTASVVPPSRMLRRLSALFFRLDLSPLSPLGIGRRRF